MDLLGLPENQWRTIIKLGDDLASGSRHDRYADAELDRLGITYRTMWRDTPTSPPRWVTLLTAHGHGLYGVLREILLRLERDEL